jgi:hypothetical protein
MSVWLSLCVEVPPEAFAKIVETSMDLQRILWEPGY